LFKDQSVRVWTVLGGIASVLALIWAIHPIHMDASPGVTSPGSPGGSVTRTAAGHLKAVPLGRSEPPPDIWIAQLASVSVSAGSAQLQQTLDKVRTEIPGAEYLDSSNYASLNPRYWVVYYRGSFGNGNQALSYCAAHGRTTRNQCVGRFLSSDEQDKSYICLPPSGSQTTGCYHPVTTAIRIALNATWRTKIA
jgi:eukaryotic-like serine/threonine-protein kinase